MDSPHSRYIIIGACPRSATCYMEEVFKQLGLDVGHEIPGRDGTVGWHQLTTVHPQVMECLERAAGRKIVWIHQVRHPVPTITSMTAMYERHDWPPLYQQEPVEHLFRHKPGDSNLLKAMKLYYHLNTIGLNNTLWQLRFRIESIDAAWPKICALAELGDIPIPKTPRDFNSHKARGHYPDISWEALRSEDELYANRIMDMASRFGYTNDAVRKEG